MPLVSTAANLPSYGKCCLRCVSSHTRCLLSRSVNVAALQIARPHRDARVMDVEQMTNRTICGPNQPESPKRLLTHQSGPTTPHGWTFGRPIDQRTSPRGARAALGRAHGKPRWFHLRLLISKAASPRRLASATAFGFLVFLRESPFWF